MRRTKVLIVDDSSVVRQFLTEILGSAPDLEVVGTACDPLVARDKIKLLSPDVLTLDVEMPRMDGLTFLSNLMRLRPMPVVMISTLTAKGADTTMRALELGAVDFIPKPQDSQGLRDYSEELCQKVRTAARARISHRTPPAPPPAAPRGPLPVMGASRSVLALGASTGGVEALGEVFMALPQEGPGVVVVQHIPNPFAGAFAQRRQFPCNTPCRGLGSLRSRVRGTSRGCRTRLGSYSADTDRSGTTGLSPGASMELGLGCRARAPTRFTRRQGPPR